MRHHTLLWLFLFFLLAACSSLNKATVATPTPNVPAGKFDGRWEGNGKNADGIPVTVFFTVQNSTVTSAYYKFVKPGFAPCYDTAYQVLNAANQPTFNLYASRIVVPTLVVWHQNDQCTFSPPAGSAALFTTIPSANKASRTFERGHSVATDPCGAFSEHGYAGIEDKVVKDIAQFIRRED